MLFFGFLYRSVAKGASYIYSAMTNNFVTRSAGRLWSWEWRKVGGGTSSKMRAEKTKKEAPDIKKAREEKFAKAKELNEKARKEYEEKQKLKQDKKTIQRVSGLIHGGRIQEVEESDLAFYIEREGVAEFIRGDLSFSAFKSAVKNNKILEAISDSRIKSDFFQSVVKLGKIDIILHVLSGENKQLTSLAGGGNIIKFFLKYGLEDENGLLKDSSDIWLNKDVREKITEDAKPHIDGERYNAFKKELLDKLKKNQERFEKKLKEKEKSAEEKKAKNDALKKEKDEIKKFLKESDIDTIKKALDENVAKYKKLPASVFDETKEENDMALLELLLSKEVIRGVIVKDKFIKSWILKGRIDLVSCLLKYESDETSLEALGINKRPKDDFDVIYELWSKNQRYKEFKNNCLNSLYRAFCLSVNSEALGQREFSPAQKRFFEDKILSIYKGVKKLENIDFTLKLEKKEEDGEDVYTKVDNALSVESVNEINEVTEKEFQQFLKDGEIDNFGKYLADKVNHERLSVLLESELLCKYIKNSLESFVKQAIILNKMEILDILAQNKEKLSVNFPSNLIDCFFDYKIEDFELLNRRLLENSSFRNRFKDDLEKTKNSGAKNKYQVVLGQVEALIQATEEQEKKKAEDSNQLDLALQGFIQNNNQEKLEEQSTLNELRKRIQPEFFLEDLNSLNSLEFLLTQQLILSTLNKKENARRFVLNWANAGKVSLITMLFDSGNVASRLGLKKPDKNCFNTVFELWSKCQDWEITWNALFNGFANNYSLSLFENKKLTSEQVGFFNEKLLSVYKDKDSEEVRKFNGGNLLTVESSGALEVGEIFAPRAALTFSKGAARVGGEDASSVASLHEAPKPQMLLT